MVNIFVAEFEIALKATSQDFSQKFSFISMTYTSFSSNLKKGDLSTSTCPIFENLGSIQQLLCKICFTSRVG